MIFDLHCKTIKKASTRTQQGSTVTLDILFTDGTSFTYRVALAPTAIAVVPKECARLFDAGGEVTRKWK